MHPFCVENLQLVRYEKGQSFGLHHDSGTLLGVDDDDIKDLKDSKDLSVDVSKSSPFRLFTIFVYLNTISEDSGGATHFPFQDQLKIQPQAGYALVWCNSDLSGGDHLRTRPRAEIKMIHEGQAITKPDTIKWGMNIWLCDSEVCPVQKEKDDKKQKPAKKHKAH